MGTIAFLKMHGLGNDFVVLDGRRTSITVDAAAACALADRRTGIGCDQVILLELPRHPAAQVLMRIRNPDGSEAEACGNATRCVADLLRRETGDATVRIETVAGLLEAETLPDGRVAVDMGPARTGWRVRATWAPDRRHRFRRPCRQRRAGSRAGRTASSRSTSARMRQGRTR